MSYIQQLIAELQRRKATAEADAAELARQIQDLQDKIDELQALVVTP